MPDNKTGYLPHCNTGTKIFPLFQPKIEKEWERKRLVRNKLSQETERNPIRNKAGTSYVNSLLNIIDKVGPLLKLHTTDLCII